jgi:iron complex outermembrane recepter protein
VNLSSPKSKLAALLGTTSLLTTLSVLAANAAEGQQTQAMMTEAIPGEIPENVLITGSLIHGTIAVGVPVTNLQPQDFAQTGAVTIGDLFKNYPQANVFEAGAGTNSGGHLERETRVNIRGLDQTGPRSLMMVDGMRFPPQADGICSIDPSIIPAIALDHIDVLADGASATYGSDAIAGVINVILRRNFDGAMTQLGFSRTTSGKYHYLASQLWGRTWDGGQITLSYEWYDDSRVMGSKHSNYTLDYTPWGLVDNRPIGSSIPGTISTGAPALASDKWIAPSTCTNCYAVPAGTGANFPGGVGPTAPFSASTLDWATFSNSAISYANGGHQNVINPLALSSEDPPQQRNAATMTLDQRLTKDISFYAEAFYSNRRAEAISPCDQNPTANVCLSGIGVPTWNPYYPLNAPSNLRVSYNLEWEHPTISNASELAQRYAFGLNIALPAGWSGQIYYSMSSDQNELYNRGAINKNAVSAALGWTIQPVAAVGTGPSFGTWTKPSNVPYLNLFCDPTQFICNSADTITYVQGVRTFDERMMDNEKGVKVDGPLFDLPGGTVKAAVGATITGVQFHFVRADNTGAPNLVIGPQIDAEPYSVWATFAQLNVPIFGDANAIPFFRKLELEASWRHDQYSGTISGATSNPKLAFTWMLSEDAGLSVKGSWGTSFRFANAGEYSLIASSAFGAFNLPANLATNGPPISVACSGGSPTPGSAAAKEVAGGLACGSTVGGLSFGGAPAPVLRPSIRTDEPFLLKPEQATNWSGGFDFAPTSFLRGLDIQATYYLIKINGVLTAFNQFSQSSFNSNSEGFHVVVPSDVGCPVSANSNPTSCAAFEDMVSGVLTNPLNSSADASTRTLVYWINDGGTINLGYRKVEGIDFSMSYDWDMGNLGAFNIGDVMTYYLQDTTSNGPGSVPVDQFHSTINTIGTVSQVGVTTLPRIHSRGRLGWSSGSWSVTGFMDYTSHWYDRTTPAPPNVNNQCLVNGTSPGGSSPCAINNYNSSIPSHYLFDLSIGYDTGEEPANDYLKRIGINVVIQNIFDKHAPFEYGFSSQARGFTAFDRLKSDEGRRINLLVTKTW